MPATREIPEADDSPRIVAFMAPGQNIKDEAWQDGLRLLVEPGTEAIYDTVKKKTGVDVIEVCQSDEPVSDPSIIQPAAYAVGYAHSEALKARGVTPDFVICFSASEVLMAAISGAVSLEGGAETAKQRGLLQKQEAGGTGGGVAVIYRRPLKLRKVKKAIQGMEGVHFAGKITPLQTTFGYRNGMRDELVAKVSNVPGVRRVMDIPNLDFGMHGPDLTVVREKMGEFFEGGTVKFKDAAIPHIATRTARLNTKAHTIMHNIIWQTDEPINFEDGIWKAQRLGVNDYYDLGPGSTMGGLLRHFALGDNIRINPVKLWEEEE